MTTHYQPTEQGYDAPDGARITHELVVTHIPIPPVDKDRLELIGRWIAGMAAGLMVPVQYLALDKPQQIGYDGCS